MIDRLARDYADALAAHVAQKDEETLSAAYDIGRRALAEGHGVLDVVAIHRAAVREDGEREAADDFFREALSPFEMAFRGYVEANVELRRMNEAVVAANRELEAFSYSVSHDLRAPLRAIAGFSRIIAEDDTGHLLPADRAHLARIEDNAVRMSRLIDDMLSLSRVGRADLVKREVDLAPIAHRVIDRLRSTQPNRDVSIVIESPLVALGDAGLLTIVLENLLGNAWKFTSRRAQARIEVGRKEDAFFVRDDGAGFDMAYASKLFGAFQRLHSAADFEGTGIGLATVQRIIHRHGGRVWAESAPGAGATFWFTLDRA
jgi:light-regulated signal transduction histidine kinase (bacteriophytochrome)